jgi:hypothetical protein
MEVYKAISAVSAALAGQGISKDRKNASQGYNFRGIDDVLQTLAGLLPTHGLVIVPRVIACNRDREVNTKGTVLFYVTADVEFDLIAVADGSKHVARFYGEAMDSGDKATNKAMSAAYKYMALQTFCIPIEGVAIDSETETHHVAAAMLPAAVADHIAAIQSASDKDTLSAAYKAAMTAGKAANDAGACDEFKSTMLEMGSKLGLAA